MALSIKSKKKVVLYLFVALFLVCAVLSVVFAQKEKKDYDSHTKSAVAMDTVVTAKTYGKNTASLNETVISIIKQLDSTISRYDENSLVYKLNEEKSLASNDISNLISMCSKVSLESDGVFDITVTSLSDLWGIGTENERIPKESEIKKALQNVGYQKIWSNNGTVSLGENQSVDLGAVGKGYACDLVYEYLSKTDIDGAVVSVGGSILAYGKRNAAGDKWRVALKHPREENAFLGTILIESGFVSTSGDYERYFEKDGKRYHHILNAKTGYPADSGLISVTVICKNGALSDALSTACFILGEDSAKELLSKFSKYDAKAIFVDSRLNVSFYGDVEFVQ